MGTCALGSRMVFTCSLALTQEDSRMSLRTSNPTLKDGTFGVDATTGEATMTLGGLTTVDNTRKLRT